MSEQITFINVGATWRRVVLPVVACLALLGGWYGLRRNLASTMAEYAADFDTAHAAERLGPDDPLAHLKLARLNRIDFQPEQVPVFLQEYERAAALAPNDYLIWMELGRARGSAGDMEGGLRALGRSVALAPAYAEPRWHLGNLLLRAGRFEEAFAELRRAAEADPARYRPQVFNTAWQIYEGDLQQVMRSIGDSPPARAQLASVLVGRGRLDDALKLWAGLSAAEKRAQVGTGETLAQALHNARRYRAALDVQRETGVGGGAELAPERVANAGFESDIGAPGNRYFDWQVTPIAGAQMVIDPRAAHGGTRSLRITFNFPSQQDFKNVSQLVVVSPATRYRLNFYVRAEELKSASTLVTEVLDGVSEQVLASSASVATGTSDWQLMTVDFTTPAQTEAIKIRFNRAPCPDGVCPMFGKVWYDDFDLQRSTGSRPRGAR